MAHDVFISYASEDKNIADATCAKLEEHGIRCWIAPRDVEPGANWGEAIVEAISSSRIMVFVFSSNSNQSQHVFREVERAVDREVTIIPLRVENILPSKPIEFFISAQHWLDAITPPLEDHLNTLAEKIRLILGKGTPPPAPLASRKKSVLIPAIAFLGVILILAGIVRLVYLGADGQESPRHPDGHSTKPSQNEAVVPANTDSTGPVGHLHTPGSAVNTLPGQGADYSRKPNREPDDSRDRANHLGFGDSIQGEIGKEGDQEDWYKVTMPTNGTFKCRVTNLHRSGVEHGDINPVSLFNEQGERLTQTSWFRPGIPVDSKAVSVSAGQACYIQIQARPKSSAPYSLSCTFTALDQPDAGEPNHDRNAAHALDPNAGIRALIGFDRDQEDWYKVTMPTNGTFKCRVTNLHRSGVEHGDINPVSLFNEQGERLTQTSWFRPGIPVDSKAVSVSAGQAYYIQIQARQTSSAPYSLSLSFTPR